MDAVAEAFAAHGEELLIAQRARVAERQRRGRKSVESEKLLKIMEMTQTLHIHHVVMLRRHLERSDYVPPTLYQPPKTSRHPNRSPIRSEGDLSVSRDLPHSRGRRRCGSAGQHSRLRVLRQASYPSAILSIVVFALRSIISSAMARASSARARHSREKTPSLDSMACSFGHPRPHRKSASSGSRSRAIQRICSWRSS